MSESAFESWLMRQECASIDGLAACLSPTQLTLTRAGFGQVIKPKPGSSVASPITDLKPDEPDYFFHWLRDSALFMEAVRRLHKRGDTSRDWPQLFGEFVSFGLQLNRQDGRNFIEDRRHRDGVQPEFRQFLRSDAELFQLHDEAVLGDVRYNPDGTLDTIKWSRPQDDGAALRALVCIRFWRDGLASEVAATLIAEDLTFTAAHITMPSVDIWEEFSGNHYYTRLVQYAALRAGIGWSIERHDTSLADHCTAAIELLALDRFWSADEGVYHWSHGAPGGKSIDTQIILAVLHADLTTGRHSVQDERTIATLAALEDWCGQAYAINRDRPNGTGIALGRYKGDRYVTAGPWYLCTFAAAEFRYRRAALTEDRGEVQTLFDTGDASMEAARRFIPPSGALTEQFDPTDGHQSSARDLGWSHAAFLTALDARRTALDCLSA